MCGVPDVFVVGVITTTAEGLATARNNPERIRGSQPAVGHQPEQDGDQSDNTGWAVVDRAVMHGRPLVCKPTGLLVSRGAENQCLLQPGRHGLDN